jgi:hypothetical protein
VLSDDPICRARWTSPTAGAQLGPAGGFLVSHRFGGFGRGAAHAVMQQDRVALPLAESGALI